LSVGLCEAELALNEELRKFYFPENDEKIIGETLDFAQQWLTVSKEETDKVLLLVRKICFKF
jgi:hypothetical protein